MGPTEFRTLSVTLPPHDRERLLGLPAASAHRIVLFAHGSSRLSPRARDRVAVIVDDLLSAGGTLVRAAKACRAAGATKVLAAATHGPIARAISRCHDAS